MSPTELEDNDPRVLFSVDAGSLLVGVGPRTPDADQALQCAITWVLDRADAFERPNLGALRVISREVWNLRTGQRSTPGQRGAETLWRLDCRDTGLGVSDTPPGTHFCRVLERMLEHGMVQGEQLVRARALVGRIIDEDARCALANAQRDPDAPRCPCSDDYGDAVVRLALDLFPLVGCPDSPEVQSDARAVLDAREQEHVRALRAALDEAANGFDS